MSIQLSLSLECNAKVLASHLSCYMHKVPKTTFSVLALIRRKVIRSVDKCHIITRRVIYTAYTINMSC